MSTEKGLGPVVGITSRMCSLDSDRSRPCTTISDHMKREKDKFRERKHSFCLDIRQLVRTVQIGHVIADPAFICRLGAQISYQLVLESSEFVILDARCHIRA